MANYANQIPPPSVADLLRDWEHTQTATATTTDPYRHITELQRRIESLSVQLADAERGLTQERFNGTHDADLVLELIARGYVVHKPLENE